MGEASQTEKHSAKQPKERSEKSRKDKREKDASPHRSKRHREDEAGDAPKKHKHRRKDKSSKTKGMEIVDDDDDGEMWVEKDATQDGQHPLATTIPTAESLNLTSHASEPSSADLPPTLNTASKLERDDWMLAPETLPTLPDTESSVPRRINVEDENMTDGYGDTDQNKRSLGGGVDFFSSLGTERTKKTRQERPDPSKLVVSNQELNTQLKDGKSLDQYEAPTPAKPQTPGGPGSQWRMQKLKRTYETAEEEGRSIEEVAVERYGSLAGFEEALEERRYLDERADRRNSRGGDRGRDYQGGDGARSAGSGSGGERYMFNDPTAANSRASSRASSFRKPGAQESGPSTPQPSEARTPSYFSSQAAGAINNRVDALRGTTAGRGAVTPPNKPSTPIPSTFTPTVPNRKRALSGSSLNKLQAKALRAKMMGHADAAKLEQEYEEELQRSKSGVVDEDGVKVEVVPTLDVRGRLYDVGTGRVDPSASRSQAGNRKKKELFETRDPKTGDLLRYNADDDSTTLGEMLRQERFGAGMADQKDLDAELAGAIMGDGKFENDLEYMDDNAEKLGRKKMRTDAMKRQFAINDYARTQKAMSTCQYCYGEDDSPPKAGVIAMGTRAYLSCTLFEELVEGHCYIVPIQHHLSMLEADDDVWDEVKNFMKCLMQMFHAQDKGVVFYETVMNLKWQKHTVIECVPVPLDIFADLPAYFKESILASEAEWSQHKKVIDFSKRPGGFRRAMVPNLPYFMVQWDYKGEKGYGHVIEGTGQSAADGEGDGAVDEGDKGGGDFPRYFAAEIIGNQLDVEPRRWRRPRKMDMGFNRDRVKKFKAGYDQFDWTHLIGKS